MDKTKERIKKPDNYWKFDDTALPVEVGLYYGFTPIHPVIPEKQDFSILKEAGKDQNPSSEPHIHAAELAALFRTYFLKNNSAAPVMTVRARKLETKARRHEYCFDILGSSRSIADATVIKASYETALELGYENCIVELNTIGDRGIIWPISAGARKLFQKEFGCA